jgi:hypothetical protein
MSDLWFESAVSYYEDHCDIWERLGVPCEERDDGDGPYVLCKFTQNTVRTYQLLHILTHELDHHHDRITTNPKSARPEVSLTLRHTPENTKPWCGRTSKSTFRWIEESHTKQKRREPKGSRRFLSFRIY